MQQHAEQNEADAEIEGEVDFAAFTEDEEGQADGVAGLQIVRQVDGKGRQALQGHYLEDVHGYGAEQGMAEHEPQVGAFGNDENGLLAGEDTEIERGYEADSYESARHLIHQHRAAAHTHAGLLVTNGIECADS